MTGYACVAAEQVSIGDYRATDARSQSEHDDVFVAFGGAPYHLAGESHAGIVIGKDRYLAGQAASQAGIDALMISVSWPVEESGATARWRTRARAIRPANLSSPNSRSTAASRSTG